MKIKLTESQRRAVHSDAKLLLVLAGPGSGKTAVITERIDRLLNDGIPSDRMVAITYTNAAANMLRARIEPAQLGFCGTLHGFCLKLVQDYGVTIGYTGKIGVIDEDQSRELYARCARELGIKVNGSSHRAKEIGFFIEKRYRNELLSNGLLSFDMLLEMGLDILRRCYDWHCEYFFIDEVHDSNIDDFNIYEQMAGFANGSVMLVCDPDQSIFNFRGAVDIPSWTKIGEVITLEENFRCDLSIAHAANKLIAHNENRIPKQTRSMSKDQGLIELRQFDTPMQEKIYVAGTIHELGYESSTAILLRTNHLVNDWKNYLRGLGVPLEDKLTDNKPLDWTYATRLIAFAGQPNNNWIAEQVLQYKNPELAEHVRLKSRSEGKSVRDLMFSKLPRITLEMLPEFLGSCNVSEASIELVRDAMDRLPHNASCEELLLMLRETDETEENQTSDGIVVSTFHGAKGCEFDNVFMPCFDQATIPGTHDIEEERRIAYVGITRARHRCVLSCANERATAYNHTLQPQQVSQFASEAL